MAAKRKRRIFKNEDSFIQINSEGVMDFGIIHVSSRFLLRSGPNVIQRPNDGQESNTTGAPIYKTIKCMTFPINKIEQVNAEEIFRLIDRIIYAGEFVKSQDGRLGFVLKTNQLVSARIIEPNNQKDASLSPSNADALYLYRKPSGQFTDRMRKHLDCQINCWVQRNGWIGRINKCVRRVELEVFTNQNQLNLVGPSIGVKCNVTRAELANICQKTLSEENIEMCFWTNSRYGFYHGKVLTLTWEVFTSINPKWEEPLKKPNLSGNQLIYLRVVDCDVRSVTVDWLQRVPHTHAPKPNSYIRKSQLGGLAFLPSSIPWRLGDLATCQMDAKSWDELFTKAMWQNTLARDYQLHRRHFKRKREHECDEPTKPNTLPSSVPVVVMDTKNESEVEWLDGTIETLPTIELNQIMPKKKFIHGTLVSLRAQVENRRRYGVIQSLDLPQSLATVQWYNIEEAGNIDTVTAVGPAVEVLLADLVRSKLRIRADTPVMRRTRSPNDQNFLFGWVLAPFPDGRVRVLGPNQSIYRLWPHQLKRVHKKNTHTTPELAN